MLQNILQKFGSLFYNNQNNKRSISPAKFIIKDEIPSKKAKLDFEAKDYQVMDGNNDKKEIFSYITRNVTTRNKTLEEKPISTGYEFSITPLRSNNCYSFKSEDDSVDYKFQGSKNLWKSTPKVNAYDQIFAYKKKFESKNKKKLTTHEHIQMKDKLEYEALVKKYSGNMQNLSVLSELKYDIKSHTNLPFITDIIDIDSFKSTDSSKEHFKIPQNSINLYSRKNVNNKEKFNVDNFSLDDERKLKNVQINDLSNLGKFEKDNILKRDSLRQSFRSNLDPSINSNYNYNNQSSSRNLSANKLLCPTDRSTAYHNDLTYLEQLGRRLKKTSKVLNDIFSTNKVKMCNGKENNHQINLVNDDDVIEIDSINDEQSPINNTLEIDQEERNLRYKDIDDFNAALKTSSFANEQYLLDLCRPAINRDVHEAIVKGETEINFYKKGRQKDEEKLINQMNKMLQITKRIPPAVDESFIFIEDEDIEFIELDEDEKKDEFPVLTPEHEQKVGNVFRMGMSEKVAVEAFRLQITYKDLSTLANLNWLNDEIINFYMNLIVDRDSKNIYSFNTFFYPKISSEGGQKSVRRWTKNIDIFTFKIILVPIHLGVHWCLAVIDFNKKQIRYYDSMGGNNQLCLHSLQKYLQDEHKDKKGTNFDLKDWQKFIVKDIPQQMNGSDCGMFACKFAEYISRDAVINFNQNHMPYFRKRMVLEIIEKKLWS